MKTDALAALQSAAASLRAEFTTATHLEAIVLVQILQETCALASRLEELIVATREGAQR